MIGDLRKVTLQEQVKNDNNQLYANIYNRILPKPRLIHNLTTLVVAKFGVQRQFFASI